MKTRNTIEKKLRNSLAPTTLEVINESHQHAGHQHGATDSHFKVVVVSALFKDMGKVARHQKIYQILAEELVDPVHALVIQAFSPEEWQQR